MEVQLREILKTNSVKLVDLFTEWDEDGNGGLDKKEFRKGVAALGYEAPQKDVDASKCCSALSVCMCSACILHVPRVCMCRGWFPPE